MTIDQIPRFQTEPSRVQSSPLVMGVVTAAGAFASSSSELLSWDDDDSAALAGVVALAAGVEEALGVAAFLVEAGVAAFLVEAVARFKVQLMIRIQMQ